MSSPTKRVAVLADVHGNAVAVEAVAREVLAARPDLVVFCGDLTWGPLPDETWRSIQDLRERVDGATVFVRGNAERALAEAASKDDGLTARERWLLDTHSDGTREALAAFAESATVEIDGLGAVHFCHGSPRSDEELVTPETPDERMRALLDGIPEAVLVTAHTHVQFDRRVAGVRSVNPGSVGLPYEGEPGAFWALLGREVELRRTGYDLDEAARRYRASSDPLAERMVELLLEPPTRADAIAHAEAREFSG
jgi:putative phosphoesterase